MAPHGEILYPPLPPVKGSREMKTTKKVDQAVGSWEAACLLGVHWTTAARMAGKGLLTTRALQSPTDSDGDRQFVVFSLSECEADWADYAERLKARGGKSDRRPRGFADLRPGAVKRMAAVDPKISFDDAISTGEAAEILGVHWTFPPRLAADGKIIGRVVWNGRNAAGRLWIFSRASCRKNAALAKTEAAAGTKKGRPRRKA